MVTTAWTLVWVICVGNAMQEPVQSLHCKIHNYVHVLMSASSRCITISDHATHFSKQFDFYTMVKRIHGNRSDEYCNQIHHATSQATARAVLANTLLPSPPKTHTHTLTHTHAHTYTLSLCCCWFLELVRQNNSLYIWLTADFVSSINAYPVKYRKLTVNANPVYYTVISGTGRLSLGAGCMCAVYNQQWHTHTHTHTHTEPSSGLNSWKRC